VLSVPFFAEGNTIPATALIALSFVLAIGPFLIAVGFDAIADRSGGGVPRSFLQVGGLGLLILGGVQVGAGILPLANANGWMANLRTVHQVGTALTIIGAFGAGTVLSRRWTRVAIPLMVGAIALIVTVIPGGPQLPAYAAWSLACVWLGLALWRTPR